jgi:hypothetical protein
MLQFSFNSQFHLQFSPVLLLPCSPGQPPPPPILYQDDGPTPEPPETNTIHHLKPQTAINPPMGGGSLNLKYSPGWKSFEFKLHQNTVRTVHCTDAAAAAAAEESKTTKNQHPLYTMYW